MTGLDMRSDGYAPRGQKFIAQRQAKRRPGYNVAVQVAPCKGKSAETERFMFTFALTGRGVMWRFTQGVASLALGYGAHWAFSPLGLSGTRRVPHALNMRKICGNLRDLWATTKRTMR